MNARLATIFALLIAASLQPGGGYMDPNCDYNFVEDSYPMNYPQTDEELDPMFGFTIGYCG